MAFSCVQVDGKSSVACYLMALDKCYASLCEKFERCRSNFERQRRLARSSSGSSKSITGKVSVAFGSARSLTFPSACQWAGTQDSRVPESAQYTWQRRILYAVALECIETDASCIIQTFSHATVHADERLCQLG